MTETINSKDLYEKMMRLQWLLQRQNMPHHRERGPFADPTRGQGRVLALLKLQPEISTKDLSYLLGIRQQSLSELLGKLEKAGYITRTPSESDKRVMMIKLTEKGKEAKQETPDFPNLFDCLNPDEQSVLSGFLDRIIANIEENLSAEDHEDMERWMEQARSRMGDEAFEHLMEMHGAMHGREIPRPGGRRPFGARGERMECQVRQGRQERQDRPERRDHRDRGGHQDFGFHQKPGPYGPHDLHSPNDLHGPHGQFESEVESDSDQVSKDPLD